MCPIDAKQSGRALYQDNDQRFSVIYTPAGRRKHQLPVKSLAESLSALSDLFESVDSIVGGGKSRIQLTYVASRPGSVEVIVDVLSLVALTVSPISPQIASYAGAVLDLVIGAKGLFAVIPGLWKLGRRADERVPQGLTVTRPDGTKVTIGSEMGLVLAHREPAHLISAALGPVETGECARIDIARGGTTLHSVDANSVEYYRPPRSAKSTTKEKHEMQLTVEKVAFDGKASWRMMNMATGKGFSCQVTDQDFLDEIRDGLRFGKGDGIDAQVTVTKKSRGSQSRSTSTYDVVHVHSHKGAVEGWTVPLYSCPMDACQTQLVDA